jgi:hypothetical protein
MLGAFVFHAQRELDDQTAGSRQLQQFCEGWVGQLVSMIVGMQSNPAHLMFLLASSHILLPIWEIGIDRAERQKQSRAIGITVSYQSRVRASDILVKDSLESPDPRLRHLLFLQLGD